MTETVREKLARAAKKGRRLVVVATAGALVVTSINYVQAAGND